MREKESLKTFDYKNTAIHYTDQGKGNAVVFLHGFLENKEMWTSTASICSKHKRVLTIDLLGHGKSGCIGYIHTMEDQADMVFSLLSHLKLRKVSLIGHSMGGYVALAFAELYPDSVRHLILLNSTARADSTSRKENRDRAIKAVKNNNNTFVRIAINNLFSDKNQKKLQKEIQQLVSEAQKTPIQGIIAALEGMKIRIDREVLLHFSPYPKLFIAGTSDSIVSLEESKNQTENSETILKIVNSGHMSLLEEPEEINQIITNFIKK